MFGAFTVSTAQTTSATPNSTMTAKKDKSALAAQKKSDREARALAKKQAKESAQAASATPAASAHLNKNGTPDKRFKANKETGASTVVKSVPAATSAHLNKNGTSDKRFKSKVQAAPAATQNQVQNTSPASVPSSASTAPNRTTAHVARTNTPTVADKTIGTDAKGRTIYQGPRGGKYYITKNGNKEYEK